MLGRDLRVSPSSGSFSGLLVGLVAAAAAASPACATGITDAAPDGGGGETTFPGSDGSTTTTPFGNGDDTAEDSGDTTGNGDDSSTFGNPDSGDDDLDHPDSGGAHPDGAAPTDSGTDSGGGGTSCATAITAATFDFTTTEGWTSGVSDSADQQGVTWPFNPWTQGTASASPACPSGKCFGAELTQNYAQCQRGYIVSPKINLSACTGKTVNLTFQHLYSFWSGSYGGSMYYDGGIVEISPDNGANWHTLTSASYPGTVTINPNQGSSYACVLSTQFHVDGKAGYVGSLNTPTTATIAVPAALVTSQMLVRFSMGSGVSSQTQDANDSRSSTSSGWRIDNVGFTAN